jgi:hypothetical protein
MVPPRKLNGRQITHRKAGEDRVTLFEEDRPSVPVRPAEDVFHVGTTGQLTDDAAGISRPRHLLQQHHVRLPAPDLVDDQVDPRVEVGEPREAVQHVELDHPQRSRRSLGLRAVPLAA